MMMSTEGERGGIKMGRGSMRVGLVRDTFDGGKKVREEDKALNRRMSEITIATCKVCIGLVRLERYSLSKKSLTVLLKLL